MAKKLYAKPFMMKEKFVPNEYISLCWYIDEGDCFNNLYHDTNTTTIWDPSWSNPLATRQIYGYYDTNEALCTNHGSHRVPAETATPKWFKADALPQPIANDEKYYTGYSSEFYNLANGYLDKYNGNVTGNIYNYNGHYFKKPTKAGGHS